MCDIGDGAFGTYEVAGGGLCEVGVEDTVEATSFVCVAFYTVFNWVCK